MTTRKKVKRNTSSRHRHRHRHRRITKRGGMNSRSLARTMIYHHIRPLFTEFKNHIGHKKMTPEEKALVLEGERYFETFADIPADDSLKASISELKKEWSNTANKAEKALGLYNKLVQTLKDDESKKRREYDRLRHLGERRADGVFASSSLSLSSSSPSLSSILSPSLSSIASLSTLRQEPYSRTPGFVERSNTDTPQKPTGKGKGSRSVMTPSTVRLLAPTLENSENPIRALDFNDVHDVHDDHDHDVMTPISSPLNSPPHLRSKKEARTQNNHLG